MYAVCEHDENDNHDICNASGLMKLYKLCIVGMNAKCSV